MSLHGWGVLGLDRHCFMCTQEHLETGFDGGPFGQAQSNREQPSRHLLQLGRNCYLDTQGISDKSLYLMHSLGDDSLGGFIVSFGACREQWPYDGGKVFEISHRGGVPRAMGTGGPLSLYYAQAVIFEPSFWV